MKKILFCGQTKSPFILQDYNLLKTKYDVDIIDLNIVQEHHYGKIRYAYRIVKYAIKKIYNSDIVYIWFADYPAVPLILLSKIFNKKCVLNVGGAEVANYPEINYGNQLKYIHRNITNWCLRNADVILVPSDAYKKITLSIEPNIKIEVIPNSIKTELCNMILPIKEDKVITALFDLNSTSVLKGISTFKSAMKKLPYNYKICDGVSHCDLMEILRKSKVYCQLSYTESFGITNLEAMACGCVPVVSDRGALPEIIGDSGIVVPYGDVDATVIAIENAMYMNGNAARDRAKLFTSSRKLKLLSKIFEDISEPLVSIVIPSYNSSQWLMETIASITVQTYNNIEIIIVDDCSTDDTQEIIKSFNDPRIKYIRNDINMGECISSRIGFRYANGKYICRLSSDDAWLNLNKLTNQVKIMESTNADWSYNAINYIGPSTFDCKRAEGYWITLPSKYGYIPWLMKICDNIILKFPRIVFLLLLTRGNPVNSSTIMFKKSSYLDNIRWSNTHRTDCDGLILYDSLLKGLKGIAIREVGTLYRIHPNQMSYNPLYLKETKTIKSEVMNKVINGNHPLWLKMVVKCIKRFKYDEHKN